MHVANEPISLKVQLSSKSCGLVGNVCVTRLTLCVLLSYMFLHIKVLISASLAQQAARQSHNPK